MKVLVYSTLFPNHVQPNFGIFVKQRMFHFAKIKGCEIKIVAPIPYSPPWPILKRWFFYSQIKSYEVMEGVEVFHPRYPLIPKVSMPLHGFLMFMATFRMMKKICKDFSFDLIDAHYIYPDGFAAVLLKKFLQKPVVLSARGSDIHQFSEFKSIKPLIKYSLKKADHVISVCEALKTKMIDLGITSDKISVIPNGVDLNLFSPIDKKIARQKLSIFDDKKTILSVGSLIQVKGFDLLLEAVADIVKKNPDILLYIIGDGPYRPKLERQIKKQNLGDIIKLMGVCPNKELKLWYSAADVFCLASSREGWPNVLMEALACGTPVVATNVWGTPEIIKCDDVGFLTERTAGSIGAGLEKALNRTWDKEKIRQHVQGRSWDCVAQEVKEVFYNI